MTEREKIVDIAKVEFDIQFGCGDYIEIGDKEAFVDSLADTLIKNNIGDIAELKARAEIAEKALNLSCDIAMKDINIIVFPNTKTQVKNKIELYNYFIQQAEKEIEEERK